MIEDKMLEKERFDARALSILENDVLETPELASAKVSLVFRAPYKFYLDWRFTNNPDEYSMF
jgi:hypothetical protein